jgi:hypothetical protein
MLTLFYNGSLFFKDSFESEEELNKKISEFEGDFTDAKIETFNEDFGVWEEKKE